MTVGLIFVVKCDQSVNSFANIANDDLRNRTIWWYMNARTKVPRSHSPAKFAANTLSDRIIYVNIGKRNTHAHACPFHQCSFEVLIRIIFNVASRFDAIRLIHFISESVKINRFNFLLVKMQNANEIHSVWAPVSNQFHRCEDVRVRRYHCRRESI